MFFFFATFGDNTKPCFFVSIPIAQYFERSKGKFDWCPLFSSINSNYRGHLISHLGEVKEDKCMVPPPKADNMAMENHHLRTLDLLVVFFRGVLNM